MEFVTRTVWDVFAWLKGEPVISAALTALLLGPGSIACWIGYHVSGVRLASGAARSRMVRARTRGIHRVEQRLESLCTALSILTDSTESGLKATITGLERLAGAVAVTPDGRIAAHHVRTAGNAAQT